MGRTGNLVEAQLVLESWLSEAREQCEEEKELDNDEMTCQLREEMTELKSDLQSRASYRRSASKKFTNFATSHSAQRCAASSTSTANAYRSKTKSMIAKQFL